MTINKFDSMIQFSQAVMLFSRFSFFGCPCVVHTFRMICMRQSDTSQHSCENWPYGSRLSTLEDRAAASRVIYWSNTVVQCLPDTYAQYMVVPNAIHHSECYDLQ